MNHTPGPWTVHQVEPWKYAILHNGPIAYAGDVGGENGDEVAAANARLIAAAPDMLALLVEMEAELGDSIYGRESSAPETDALCRAARAAIAKATGEEVTP